MLFCDEQKQSEATSERDLTTSEDDLIPETLIQNHDAFINSLKSRLTKLQVITIPLKMII